MALTDLSNLKIMIVDSNVFIARTLASILEAFNIKTIINCQTIENAEKALVRSNLDCIFIDFMMDDRTGLGFIKHVRETEGGKNEQSLPIILTTAVTDIETIILARDFGVSEIISKPFSPDQVLSKMDNAINSPRKFIDVDEYLGPNRRRQKNNKTDWEGDKNRRNTAPQ